jgi:hypothetical protein
MTSLPRARAPEILDGDAFTEEELAGNLADIRRYNRWAGGARAVVDALDLLARRLPAGRPISILDVGAGSADLAAAAEAWARRRGLRPRVVACDASRRVLGAARSWNGGLPAGVRLCLADARALPHADGAFDLAFASLLLHHLDDGAAVAVLGELRRVTRLGFAVIDLRRSRPALMAVGALARLSTRNRLTLNDAPLSVRRALTPAEARALAGAALPEDRAARADVRRIGIARLRLTYEHPSAGRGGA